MDPFLPQLSPAEQAITAVKPKIWLLVMGCMVLLAIGAAGAIVWNDRRSPNQPATTTFYIESLGAIEKDTSDIEIQEVFASTHQGGSSYQLIILVKRESGVLPERLYVVEKETKQETAHSVVGLSRFQTGCREVFDPAIMAKYETEFFKVNTTLPFSKDEPALKNNFFAVIVYQDTAGQRYVAWKTIDKVCQVMME